MTALYFVSHGCAAALSACRDGAGLHPQRGEAVVIRSARGLELGSVLCAAAGSPSLPFSVGELLRRATDDDRRSDARWQQRGRLLLDDAQAFIDEQRLPLVPLDVDITLDGVEAAVHVLRWEPCPLTPLLEELGRRHPFVIHFFDNSRARAEHAGCGSCGSGGCGSGGCGSGGCGSGCGSDSCARGSAGSSAEMTALFARLRQQMESQRLPLC